MSRSLRREAFSPSAPLPQRHPAPLVADHQVVDEFDADDLAGAVHSPGEGDILPGGGRITGRVVVPDDDASGVEEQGGLQDQTRLDGCPVQRTGKGALPADELVPGVQVCGQHDLLGRVPELLPEEGRYLRRSAERGCRHGGVLLEHQGDAVAGQELRERERSICFGGRRLAVVRDRNGAERAKRLLNSLRLQGVGTS